MRHSISVFSYGLPYESENPRLCRVSGLTSAMARAWGKASLDSRASAELRCKIGRSSPKRNRHLEGTGSFAFHTPIRRSRLCRRHPLRPVPQAHLRPACGRAGDDVPRGDGGVRYCALRHPPSRRSPETLHPNPVRPPRCRLRTFAGAAAASLRLAATFPAAAPPTVARSRRLIRGALPSFSGNGSFSTSRSMNSSIRRNLPCSFSLTKVSARPWRSHAPYGRCGGYNPRGRAARRS